MVISYNVEEASLRYVPGDSDYITVRAAPESGVQFTSDSRFSSVMGGSWITEVGNPQIGAYFFSQKFTTGGMVPFHSRTEFTITNVQMPTTCYATGAWDINIGIWRLVSTPANKTSLAECPKITNLEVAKLATPSWPLRPCTIMCGGQVGHNDWGRASNWNEDLIVLPHVSYCCHSLVKMPHDQQLLSIAATSLSPGLTLCMCIFLPLSLLP